MSKLPRLLICAPASGGGKTTVTCGLLQALAGRGADPVAFKCGPDYIDPMFHSRVIGVPSRNLDLFFLGPETARALLARNGAKAGVAVIEGVMGYYDGIGMSADASAYDLARTTGTPAVLVADVRGRALSTAALVKGLREFRPDSGIRGVILNRCPLMLYDRLKTAIETENPGVKVYGFLPNLQEIAIPSRHLGLMTAFEVKDLQKKLDVLARQMEATVELDGLLALAGTAPDLPEAPGPVPQPPGPILAVAQDEAFCFYYQDALDTLEAQGFRLAPFSPMRDEALPAGAAALYLGGGYPEVHAQALSENRAMRAAVRRAVQDGMPTVAECGGFLYLHAFLEGEDGQSYPMAGAVPASAFRTEKLGRFGYATLTAKADNLLCARGSSLPAHEFHYWDSTAPGDGFTAQKPQSDRSWPCVHATGTLYAGFPHLHFAASPGAAARFAATARTYQEGKQL